MRLPTCTPAHQLRSDVHDAGVSIIGDPCRLTVCITVSNAAGKAGIELSAWDADALAGMIHAAVTETLFDLPAVS